MLARDIALAAARAHLRSGHDVVVPQFLGRMTFLAQLERLAGEVNATFHEIVLLDSKENMLRRFAERSRAATDPVHVDAAERIERPGGFDDLPVFLDVAGNRWNLLGPAQASRPPLPAGIPDIADILREICRDCPHRTGALVFEHLRPTRSNAVAGVGYPTKPTSGRLRGATRRGNPSGRSSQEWVPGCVIDGAECRGLL